MEASPPEPPDPPDPRLGAVLQGRYRLDAQLASGAMGVVYRGERLQLGRPVAVKFLHPWIATQQAFLSRFENEARAMSRLQHPNCVSVLDFGVEGTPYLVMDFVTGPTLRQVMAGVPVEPSRALRIVRQLLAGLGYAHAQGIIHRDLKPENLILSDEPGLSEHLRILDFGLAKLRDGPAMTAGLAVGTPSYMSPEQTGAEGAIDARTDLYAVGVVLFELLAGRKPFQSENVGELLLMQREQAPPLLRSAAPASSAALEGVVSKALSKFATERFQSAAEFTAALDATPEGGGARAAVAAPPARKATAMWSARPAAGAAAAPAATPRASVPAPLPSPAAPRPVPAPPAEPTIVDSASQIRRLVGGEAAPRDRRMVWVGVGLGGIAVAALIVGHALAGHALSGHDGAASKVEASHAAAVAAAVKPHPQGADSNGARPAASATKASPPADLEARLGDARRLLARGDWEQARAGLESLRAAAPEDADVAYLLATIDLEHHRFAEGLVVAQTAVRRNPTLRADPDLLKDVIQALGSDPNADRAEGFLRAAGAPATPFLKDAARRDPNPRVRDRAAAILAGERRPGWSSSRTSSSSSSVFHR